MRKQIVAFGEVMMRLQVPGYELLTQANTLQYSFSGTGVNVASAMTKLGHDGYLVTKLPDNPLGDAAISSLQRLGISRNFITRGGKYLGMYFWKMALDNERAVSPTPIVWKAALIQRHCLIMILK